MATMKMECAFKKIGRIFSGSFFVSVETVAKKLTYGIDNFIFMW